MPKTKSKKGEKVDLSQFLKGAVEELPPLPAHATRDRYRDHGGYSGGSGGGGRRNGRGFYEDGDSGFGDAQWRPARSSTTPSNYDHDNGGGFYRSNNTPPMREEGEGRWRGSGSSRADQGDFERRSAVATPADEISEWRGSGPSKTEQGDFERRSAVVTQADEISEWRGSGPSKTEQGDFEGRSAVATPADEISEWRGSGPSKLEQGDIERRPAVNPVDEISEWRGRPQTSSNTSNTQHINVAKAADLDDQWRSSPSKPSPETPIRDAVAEVDAVNEWRRQAASEPNTGSKSGHKYVSDADKADEWRRPSSKISRELDSDAKSSEAHNVAEWREHPSKSSSSSNVEESETVSHEPEGPWRQPTIPNENSTKPTDAQEHGDAPHKAKTSVDPSGPWRTPQTGDRGSKAQNGRSSARSNSKKGENLSQLRNRSNAPWRQETPSRSSDVESPVVETPVIETSTCKDDVNSTVESQKNCEKDSPVQDTKDVTCLNQGLKSDSDPSGSAEAKEREPKARPFEARKGVIPDSDVFASSRRGRERKFGDRSDDLAREEMFKGGSARRESDHSGAHAFRNSRRGQYDERSETPELDRSSARGIFGSGNRRDAERDRERAAAAFSGNRRDAEKAEEHERASMAFSGGRRRDQERIEDRERVAAAAFGSNSNRRREPEQDEDRQRALLAFNSGRRRDADDGEDRERASAAFGVRRREAQDDDRQKASVAFGGRNKNRETALESDGWANEMRNTLPKETGELRTVPRSTPISANASSSHIEPAATIRVADNLSEKERWEINESDAIMLLKNFEVYHTKKDAVNAAVGIENPEFRPRFVELAVKRIFNYGRVTDCKLMVSLLVELLEVEWLNTENVVAGFEVVVKSCASNEQELRLLQTFGEILSEMKHYNFEFSSEVRELISLSSEKEQAAKRDSEEDGILRAMVTELIQSDKLGDELVSVIESKSPPAKVGVFFVKELLKLKPELVKDTDQVWLDSEQYGGLLEKVLYSEEATDVQIEAIIEIQTAFNAAGFPRDSKRQALIEKAFMKLYDSDIVSFDAILAWRDDLTETPGKLDAIIQLSEFISHIESMEEDDDDDEDTE